MPAVRADQMRRADELAEAEFHLQPLQMMENAGLNLARLARRLLPDRLTEAQVVALIGPGGNGAGGLAAARRLSVWGARVQLFLSGPSEGFAAATQHQLRGALAAGAQQISSPVEAEAPDLILDSLLGYSARGAPRPPMDSAIHWANRSAAPIAALDLPTGLDPDSGRSYDPIIQAHTTLTLALPKSGLMTDEAAPYLGELWLADISLPPSLFRRLDVEVPVDLFHMGELVQLVG